MIPARARREDGNVLVTAMLVMMLLMIFGFALLWYVEDLRPQLSGRPLTALLDRLLPDAT